MITSLTVSAPIFAAVLLGWLATRFHVLSRVGLDSLGAFAFKIALPALIFSVISRQPPGAWIDPLYAVGIFASCIAVFLGVWCATAFLGIKKLPGLGHAITAVIGNHGFLGQPLLVAYFGESLVGPLALSIIVELMIVMTLAMLLMSAARGQDKVTGASLLKAALQNPVLIAIVAGSLIAGSGVGPPEPLARLASFIGAAAGPTALVSLGASLDTGLLNRHAATSRALVVSAKLVAYPILAFFVLSYLLGAESAWTRAGVLLCALPPAGVVYVVAQQYGADAEEIGSIAALSMIVGVITVPAAAWLVGAA